MYSQNKELRAYLGNINSTDEFDTPTFTLLHYQLLVVEIISHNKIIEAHTTEQS